MGSACLPAGHTPTQRQGTPTQRQGTPTSQQRQQQQGPHSAGISPRGTHPAAASLSTPGAGSSPLVATGTPPGSASQRLSDLQQRHAQLLADVDSAERSRQQAQALSARAEGEAAAMLQRLAVAGQQAQEREAAVTALAAEEAASQQRLAQLSSSRLRQRSGRARRQSRHSRRPPLRSARWRQSGGGCVLLACMHVNMAHSAACVPACPGHVSIASIQPCSACRPPSSRPMTNAC
jgi:hypothetical protein